VGLVVLKVSLGEDYCIAINVSCNAVSSGTVVNKVIDPSGMKGSRLAS
jgi:hypothetical protein